MKEIRPVSRNKTGNNVQFSFCFFLLKLSPFPFSCTSTSRILWKVIFQSNWRPARDKALECKDKA